MSDRRARIAPGKLAAMARAQAAAEDATQHDVRRIDVALHDQAGAMALHTFTMQPEDGEAAAAKLNKFDWAQSLGGFLAAIGDKDDRAGARQVIRRVMEENRPRVAAGMNERIPAAGGFLVPEVLAEQIRSFMTTAVIRPRASVIEMDSLRVPVPTFGNLDQDGGQALAGLTFAWTQEGAGITPTVPQFDRLALEARKAAAYLQAVPNELVDDASTFTSDFLGRIIGEGLAWFEDDNWLNGTGIGEPQGLLNAPAALQVDRTTSNAITAADIVACYKQLHPQSKRGRTAVWLVSDAAFAAILDISVNVGSATSGIAGTSLWLDWSEAEGCWTLLGQPLYPTDHQPELGTTGDVVLADLSLYLIGDLLELTIERAAQGAGFISNTSDFRIRVRQDGRYWPQTTFTLKTGQVVSPLVILNSAS